MRIALVGAGAFGEKHLDGLKNIDQQVTVSVAGSSGAAGLVSAGGWFHSIVASAGATWLLR